MNEHGWTPSAVLESLKLRSRPKRGRDKRPRRSATPTDDEQTEAEGERDRATEAATENGKAAGATFTLSSRNSHHREREDVRRLLARHPNLRKATEKSNKATVYRRSAASTRPMVIADHQ